MKYRGMLNPATKFHVTAAVLLTSRLTPLLVVLPDKSGEKPGSTSCCAAGLPHPYVSGCVSLVVVFLEVVIIEVVVVKIVVIQIVVVIIVVIEVVIIDVIEVVVVQIVVVWWGCFRHVRYSCVDKALDSVVARL
jgi:hypothetical protein